MLDTNVPIVANRRDGGSYACASACAQELLALKSNGLLLLDDQQHILTEYKRYLNHSGQPGAGDAFLRWFFNNRGRRDLCVEVAINPISHAWRHYEEFPDDENLSDFDIADQKFVATARAGKNATIVQSSDHRWLAWSNDLGNNGVSVRFICEGELRATAARKS